jgi:hypothetical protein
VSGTVTGLIIDLWRRLERSHGQSLIHASLSYLTLAKEVHRISFSPFGWYIFRPELFPNLQAFAVVKIKFRPF